MCAPCMYVDGCMHGRFPVFCLHNSYNNYEPARSGYMILGILEIVCFQDLVPFLTCCFVLRSDLGWKLSCYFQGWIPITQNTQAPSVVFHVRILVMILSIFLKKEKWLQSLKIFQGSRLPAKSMLVFFLISGAGCQWQRLLMFLFSRLENWWYSHLEQKWTVGYSFVPFICSKRKAREL